MHERLDCECSSRGSIYIHEEGSSNGVIDSWNGNGDQYWSASQYIGWLSWSLPGDDLDSVGSRLH
jgi:hypothetical protein